MISFIDIDNKVFDIEYDKKTTYIKLPHKFIKKIIKIEGFDNLEELDLSFNKLESITGLENLLNLKCLNLKFNNITEIFGLNTLINLEELDLMNNKIKTISGLERLTKLTKLFMNNNELTEIIGLDKLVNLTALYICYNRIEEIKGLDNLMMLRVLYLRGNRIEIASGLDGLINLIVLDLSKNYEMIVPFTIMNLRCLQILIVDHKLDPIITRFLIKNNVKEGKSIYDDAQNVHDSHIVECVKKSIYNIMSETKRKISIDETLNSVLGDTILEDKIKEQIVEYCQDETIHSLLNLTFGEVFCYVWGVIMEHEKCNEIKKILNIEMKDSICKCFTGRLSRLINCLNGFDERVSIKISDNQEILNVIIKEKKQIKPLKRKKKK
jgi:hypothetical protein